MFTRFKSKYIGIIMIVIATLLLPYVSTANAYGVINHENVVDAGKDHFIVLKDDGSVWSWGSQMYGQLGTASVVGSSNRVLNPLAIQKSDGNRLLNIKAIAAGGYHSVALDESGKVWTWGRNSYGQLGHSATVYENEKPVTVAGLPPIVAIAAGDNHTLAVDHNGEVWAWGRNTYGQLGVAGANSVPPVKVSLVPQPLGDIVAVAAGAEHSVALKRDGTVWAWGQNSLGQLGNGQTTDVNTKPTMVSNLTGIMRIAAGDNHTVALKQDQTSVWAWGMNSEGQLGDGGLEKKLIPIRVEGMRDVTTIATGNNHTIAIKDDGTVWAWGRNTSGTKQPRPTPIQIKGMDNAISIGGGGNVDSFILAVKGDGTVWMWDRDSSDSTTKLPIFKKVSGIDNVMKLDEFPFVQGGEVLFRYIGTGTTTDVKVNGDFSNESDIPLVHVGQNVWELQVTLPPGEYNYGFIVNHRWMADPLNPKKTIDDFGRTFSILKVMPYATEGPIIDNKEVTFTYSSHDFNQLLELDAKTSTVAVKGNFGENAHWDEIPLEKQANNTWKLTKTLPPGDYNYSFVVRDSRSSGVSVERNDPLNPNIQTDSLTGTTRNTFHISESILTKIPVSGVSLNKGPVLDLIVGEQEVVRATVSPTDATNKNINWTSTNPSVVSIDETGRLTAHSQGMSVIYVTTVDGGKSAYLTVTVARQDGAVSYPLTGYEQKGDHKGVKPTKEWRVSFTQPLDRNSIVSGSVYVLNESGVRVPIGYDFENGDKRLVVRTQSGLTYKRGATYYLFIEDTVTTNTGQKLKEKVQMKFQIEL